MAIAQALLTEPKLLILDEPTSGLDPNQVIAVRELIRSLAGARTIVLASHVLIEIEKVASRVMILLDGRLLTADALRANAGTMQLGLQAAGSEASVRAVLGGISGVSAVSVELGAAGRPHRYRIAAQRRAGLAAEIAAALAAQALPVSELVEIPADLEQVFLDLTRRRVEAAA